MDGVPCWWCWDARADETTASQLLDLADTGFATSAQAAASLGEENRQLTWSRSAPDDEPELRELHERGGQGFRTAHGALDRLGRIADPRAAPVLRRAVAHSDPRIRAAVWSSLGWSGDAKDIPGAVGALADVDPRVRRAAIAVLGELGGPDAADALAGHQERCDGDELAETVFALAWLRDPRALPKARELAAEELAGKHPRRRATSVRALFRIGEPSDRHALREAALAEARRTSRGGPVSEKVWWALSVECPDEATEFGRGMSEQRSQAPDYMVYEPTLPVDREPLLPRTVPRLSLVESSGDAPPRTGPRARFGGQPDWLSTPAWPLASDGRPLTFYGQLPLLGEPARMAYIFISVARNAETWAPLGDGNAVVIQPGPPPHLATREWATGPQLFSVGPIEWGFREPPSRFQAVDHPVELQPGADPAEWTWPELGSHEYIADEQRAWNKIGGTPSWLQGPQLPPGDGWQFAFQFTAAWAGEEMGDGAECYGFVRDDGTGAFLWQCH